MYGPMYGVRYVGSVSKIVVCFLLPCASLLCFAYSSVGLIISGCIRTASFFFDFTVFHPRIIIVIIIILVGLSERL